MSATTSRSARSCRRARISFDQFGRAGLARVLMSHSTRAQAVSGRHVRHLAARRRRARAARRAGGREGPLRGLRRSGRWGGPEAPRRGAADAFSSPVQGPPARRMSPKTRPGRPRCSNSAGRPGRGPSDRTDLEKRRTARERPSSCENADYGAGTMKISKKR